MEFKKKKKSLSAEKDKETLTQIKIWGQFWNNPEENKKRNMENEE